MFKLLLCCTISTPNTMVREKTSLCATIITLDNATKLCCSEVFAFIGTFGIGDSFLFLGIEFWIRAIAHQHFQQWVMFLNVSSIVFEGEEVVGVWRIWNRKSGETENFLTQIIFPNIPTRKHMWQPALPHNLNSNEKEVFRQWSGLLKNSSMCSMRQKCNLFLNWGWQLGS